MVVSLTKAAKKTIARIYNEYLQRRSEGQSKMQARYFDNYDITQKEFINSVWEDIPELHANGMVNATVTACFELTDSGIVYMENIKAETIKEWLSFGAQFIP